MEKIEIKSIEMNPNIFGDRRLWDLVNGILREKWDYPDDILKDGDISESLLREICKVLRERAEKGIEWKEEHNWASGRYRREFDEA